MINRIDTVGGSLDEVDQALLDLERGGLWASLGT